MTSINSKRNSSKNGSPHVIPENGHWVVRVEGKTDSGIFATQAEALSAARAVAKTNEEIIVYNSNGRKHAISDSPTDAGMLQIWESIYRSRPVKRKK